MGKGTLGVVVAGVITVFGALQAEAQHGIDITGPSRVDHTQSIMQVTATQNVWTVFSWWAKTWHNGVLKNSSGNQGGSGGSILHNVCYMNTWGLVPGDTLTITVKIWVGTTSYTDTQVITVTQGELTYMPSEDRVPRNGAVQEAVAWLDRKDVEVLA